MKNRMSMLLIILAAFMFTGPVLAAPPDETKVTEVADEAKATDAADEAKATDAADATKGEETAVDDAKGEGTSAAEPKAGETSSAETEGQVTGPAEIKTDEEALDTMSQLVAAAKEGHWALVVALAIMLLVNLLNRFGIGSKIGPKAVPWLAAGTGVLGYVAAHLMVDGATITDGVTKGILAGAGAVGLWEMFFKHVMGSKTTSSGGS